MPEIRLILVQTWKIREPITQAAFPGTFYTPTVYRTHRGCCIALNITNKTVTAD